MINSVLFNTNVLSCKNMNADSQTSLCTDLRENLWSDIWLGIKEVQHVARMLNAVFCRLLGGGEPVVPRTVEVFETACAVFEFIALAGYDCLLLGHTARGDGVPNLK